MTESGARVPYVGLLSELGLACRIRAWPRNIDHTIPLLVEQDFFYAGFQENPSFGNHRRCFWLYVIQEVRGCSSIIVDDFALATWDFLRFSTHELQRQVHFSREFVGRDLPTPFSPHSMTSSDHLRSRRGRLCSGISSGRAGNSSTGAKSSGYGSRRRRVPKWLLWTTA